MNYKEKIIEMVKSLEEEKFLKFLYELIISFKEKWGY